MGFLDRLFGRGDDEEQRRQQEQMDWEQRRRQDDLRRGAYGTQGQGEPTRPVGQYGQMGGQQEELTDEQAVERYRYMLRTAPPEAIEEAHAEAFGKLTPQQRQMVLQELTQNLSEHERRAAGQRDDPRSLARMATRAEMRQPGTLERTFSGVNAGGAGIGMGGLMAGSFFSSFAGMLIGGMVANAIFGGMWHQGYGQDQGQADGENAQDTGDTGDAGQDSGDYGSGGDSADYGGGDYGSDFGGGDFGGGDFGGFGDF